MHLGFKELHHHYKGVSTKIFQPLYRLYIFMRFFMGMDNQEMLMVFLAKVKETIGSYTKVMSKSQNLLLI